MDEIDELLDQVFPQPEDNTIEWLCYCLSPYQAAIVFAMLDLNASNTDEDKQASYRQRQQRLWNAMRTMDDDEVNKNNIRHAKEFVNKENIL